MYLRCPGYLFRGGVWISELAVYLTPGQTMALFGSDQGNSC